MALLKLVIVSTVASRIYRSGLSWTPIIDRSFSSASSVIVPSGSLGPVVSSDA